MSLEPLPSRSAARGSSPRLDPGDTEKLLCFVLLTMMAVCIVVGIVGSAFGDPHDRLVGALGAPSSALFWYSARRGHARWAAWGATLFTLFVTVAVVATRRGSHDHGILVFPLIIIVSQVLFERRAANWLSGVTLFAATAIPFAEAFGLLHTDLARATGLDSALLMPVFIGTTWLLVRVLVDRLLHGLERAFVHEQSYKELFNATTEAIFVHDAETGAVLDVNESACAMGNLTREQLLTLNIQDFDLDSKYSGKRALSLIQKAVAEGPQSVEWYGLLPNGSRIWLEITLRAAVIQGQLRVLAVLRNIEERKRLQERVVESAKLEAVGRLAGGIAHDFNNQLTGILASGTLLQESLRNDRRLSAFAETIIRCSQRSAELTGQLLAFARKAKRHSVVLDLNALVVDVVALLERSTDKRIRVTTQLSPSPVPTLGDLTLLNSALLNLGINARDAMPHGGTLTFETSLVEIGAQVPGPRGFLPPGTYARVVVSDTGIGMDESTRNQLFEPFFTTKQTGNGMGLPTVYGTIESHQGAISVETKEGQGSRFEILLPHSSEPIRQSKSSAATRPRFDGTTILLAEDEPDVAKTTIAALEALGCSVTHSRDGRELVERFSAEPDRYDVLIVDQVMPRLSGQEALEKILSLKPEARVLVISGYTEHDTSVLPLRAHGFLPKPFDLDGLSIALEQFVLPASSARKP